MIIKGTVVIMKQAKIAIIGSGSTYTPELIEGLIQNQDALPVKELVLMDIDERKLTIVGELARRMVSHAGLTCRFSLTMELDEALDGADFVFAQIRVGKLPARVLDEKIPLKYDLIGQETTGIGGFFKALRTAPVLLDMCKRMETLCPAAHLINFSNPSGINAQALLTHTKTPVMGLCNVPIGMIDDPLEAFGLPKEGSEVDYVGLNHLSFVTSVRNGGRDYLKEAVEGNEELLDKLDGLQGFPKEIIRLVKAIPCGYLDYYYNPRKALAKEKAEPKSRGEVCMEIEEDLLKLYSDAGLYIKPALLSKRGGSRYSEVALALAVSVWKDDGTVQIVNTLNKGAVPYMADDDVVEIKAKITKDGPVVCPTDTHGNKHVQALMRTVKAYERFTAEAALTGDKDKALLALLANPLIVDYTAAKACFEEMLEAHRQYLPLFFE